MVGSFQFSRLPLIFFRSGGVSELPGLAKKYGSDIILVTGKKSFLSSSYAELLLDGCRKQDITIHPVTITGEPSPEMVDDAVKDLSGKNIRLVIGIGGGVCWMQERRYQQ